MLKLRDLDLIIQCSDIANFSLIAQLTEALQGNILSKWYMYMYFSLKTPNRTKLDDSIGISRSADFASDLATRALDAKAAMLNALSFIDAKCTVQAIGL